MLRSILFAILVPTYPTALLSGLKITVSVFNQRTPIPISYQKKFHLKISRPQDKKIENILFVSKSSNDL